MIKNVPNVIFQTRVRDDSLGGDNPFKWEERPHLITFQIKG